MKKLVFFLSLFLIVGVANAQSSCCAKKAGKEKACSKTEKAKAETKVASAYMEADALAESDPTIKKRVCAQSGSISYYQKSTCEMSGKVSWDEVEYDADEKKFTKVASAYVEKELDAKVKSPTEKAKMKKACCSKKEKKACCSGKEKKSCSKKEGA